MSSSFSKGMLLPRVSLLPPPHSRVGQLIADKYRLVRVLGHGGMGVVYKAENAPIGKVVAIKLLHRNLADDPVAMQRFAREARATVAIAHPNIVEVLDMGHDDRGAPFLVMEYVRGTNLKQLLRATGPMPVERSARIAGLVAGALVAAHGRGIIHRDLKPENILVTRGRGAAEQVKVVDFGISTFINAMAEQERQLDLTPTGMTMATPFYASPEQIRGAKGRDPRVDLYAVGVLLYEMLTGHRPFQGDNLPDLCARILSGEVAPLCAFRSDVPPAFENVVRRALAIHVHERFQSANELLLALVPFGAERSRHEEPEPTDTFTAELRLFEPDARPTLAERHTLGGALISHFEQRFGPARVEAAVAGLGDGLSALRTNAQCDGDALGRVLAQLDSGLGRSDRAEIVEAGRHAARLLGGTAALPKSPTPELFFSLSAGIWRHHFPECTARVSRVGRGYGRLEIGGERRRSVALTLAMLGLLEEGLRASGGVGVSVHLAACSALGEPSDAYEASWR